MKAGAKRILALIIDFAMLPLLPLVCIAAAFTRKEFDVGIGPWVSVSAAHQKAALERHGYRVETFAFSGDATASSLDYLAEPHLIWPFGLFLPYALFVRSVLRYRALYIPFVGGALGERTFGKLLEPLLYKLAGVKVVILPFGSDVQEFSRSPNLMFKHAMSQYDRGARLRRNAVARRIDRWTRWADHLVGGVEWVDYMYHWDTLTLTHFGIDLAKWPMVDGTPWSRGERATFVLVHGTNHPMLKGTQHFEQAVRELRAEGEAIELRVLRGVSNERIRSEIAEADAVADQLVVGWYAMFSMEAMACGKPVFCFLREDLIRFYEYAGVLDARDLPIINCDPLTVKQAIRALMRDKQRWQETSRRSRAFVEKYHSIEIMGRMFDAINRKIGVLPSSPRRS
jgi:glycosyltransferase involved in cell wall biosynthesis